MKLNTIMRFKGRHFFIGAVIIFIITLFSPDFANIVLLSILCTFGVGLLFWIPIALVLGKFVTLLFLLATRRKILDSPVQQKTVHFNGVVRDYIIKARTQGIKDMQIRDNLKNAGWSKDEIDNAFKAA